MRKRILIFLFAVSGIVYGGKFPIGDKWYQNPLGFEPVNLHTKNGFLIPAAAIGIILLTTKYDSTAAVTEIFNENGISWGYKYPYATVFMNNTGVVRYIRNRLSVGVDAGFYFPRDAYNNSFGVAIRPFARYDFLKGESWRCYFESGGGFIYFNKQFPQPSSEDNRLGTYWNGTTRYGLGCIINLTKDSKILFGARHVHVSNGNTKGVERNPSHDSNGFFAGFVFSN